MIRWSVRDNNVIIRWSVRDNNMIIRWSVRDNNVRIQWLNYHMGGEKKKTIGEFC